MRCFVGLFPPSSVQSSVHEALLGLGESGLRWTPPENLHLTLLFLGDVSESAQPELRGALDRAVRGFEALDLRLGGLGAFPPRGRPRVLFVDLLEGIAEVRRLHEALRRELPPELRPSERRLHPHLTVARPKGRLSAGDRERLSEAMSAPRWEFRCEGVDLVRSELSPSGATYHRLRRAPLGGV